MIDGCSTLGIYWNIILPNAKPALVTLGLIQFLAGWDAFFWLLGRHHLSKEAGDSGGDCLVDYKRDDLLGPDIRRLQVVLPVLVLFLFLQSLLH